jgi:hypothetical protein
MERFGDLDVSKLEDIIPKDDVFFAQVTDMEEKRWFYIYWSARKWTTGINLLNKYMFSLERRLSFRCLKSPLIGAMHVEVKPRFISSSSSSSS